MPTVLRVGPYRFHFYSDERNEPAHIHVEFGDSECEFWLEPVRLAKNIRVPRHKLQEMERLVIEHRDLLLRSYYEFHRKSKD